MNNQLLVSIVVITYNSSKYVLETLESAKVQTYQNIELIVSDDCSTDDTVDVCQNWLDENKERFVRTELLTVLKNTGVSANCNRGYKVAKGEWIKGVAGDDMLFPHSISDYLSFVIKTQCDICFGKLMFFGDNEELVEKSQVFYEKNYYPYLKMDQKSQLNEILKRLFVPGPGLFYSKVLWDEVGGFDEKYPFCEEYPFTYKILNMGKQIYFIDTPLLLYRIREGSLCRDVLGLNDRVFRDNRQYFIDYRRWQMLKRGLILHVWHESLLFFYTSLKYRYGINFKFLLFLSPIAYYIKAKRVFRVFLCVAD
ncbi:putative glycosyltransferase EpsE [termite gut metagenome]|uniref:Putative glycosyltransferase EpsE n=1 Tax=termite gut metagenome TaxID=433724 RepID=A0A5J4S1T4_9ZZZZ